MVTPETTKHLKELIRQRDSQAARTGVDTDSEYRAKSKEFEMHAKKAIDAAGEICQCVNCSRKRMQREMSQCDKNAILEHLPGMIFGRGPNNFIPELSPNWDFKTGTLTKRNITGK
jgi:hypothetical protein